MSDLASMYGPPPPPEMDLKNRTLGGFVRQQEAKRADPQNWVDLANTSATPNLPITPQLQQNINAALAAAYGPGFRAQVYSGGQPAIGSGGARVGSTRHDGGNAADVYILDPQGQRVTGDALAPLARHWLENKKGGVGLEMKGGGIHLDTHTNRAPFWSYGPLSPAQAELAKRYAGMSPAVRQMTAPAGAMGAGPVMGGKMPAFTQPGIPQPMAVQEMQQAPQVNPVAQFALAQMFQQQQQGELERQQAEQRQAEVARRRALFG